MRCFRELLVAVQFLTRLPVPPYRYEPTLVPGAAKFYPLAGALIGLGAWALDWALRPHLPGTIFAAVVLAYLVLVTGGMHEDGLADSCDGLGAGGERARMLEIMRDSRMGSYGTLAIVFSVLARWALLAAIAPERFVAFVIAAQVFSRWTPLPLGFFLPSAREQGLGQKVAGKVSLASLVVGSCVALAIAALCLGWKMLFPAAAVVAVTAASGALYRARLGGITGDCFGATAQLSEIGVYLCAVWQ
jgi:adenosylcobinamide-GDP ribazoletransferase